MDMSPNFTMDFRHKIRRKMESFGAVWFLQDTRAMKAVVGEEAMGSMGSIFFGCTEPRNRLVESAFEL
jgi:hypothetical protein